MVNPPRFDDWQGPLQEHMSDGRWVLIIFIISCLIAFWGIINYRKRKKNSVVDDDWPTLLKKLSDTHISTQQRYSMMIIILNKYCMQLQSDIAYQEEADIVKWLNEKYCLDDNKRAQLYEIIERALIVKFGSGMPSIEQQQQDTEFLNSFLMECQQVDQQ